MTKEEKIVAIRKKALQIFLMAMKLNSGGAARENGKKNTIFIRYSGHVDGIDIDIHYGGWEPDDKPSKSYCVYLYGHNELEEIEKAWREVKDIYEKQFGPLKEVIF